MKPFSRPEATFTTENLTARRREGRHTYSDDEWRLYEAEKAILSGGQLDGEGAVNFIFVLFLPP